MIVTVLPVPDAGVPSVPAGAALTVTVFVSPLPPHAATPTASSDAAAMEMMGRVSDIAIPPVWTGISDPVARRDPADSAISTAPRGAAAGRLRGRSGPW